MAKQVDEAMACSLKGLSFFDWDGLDNDEYSKLSGIINTSNKSSGVELLYEDEDSIDNKANEVHTSMVVESKTKNVNDVYASSAAAIDGKHKADTNSDNAVVNSKDSMEEEVVASSQDNGNLGGRVQEATEEDEALPLDKKQKEERVCVVDVENSVLQPSAPVFQPSIPPPSMMPFPIAVPHWTPHHHDPNMPLPTHQGGHHYSYTLPGSYVFHPHDPSLAAATHHPHHGHNGESTTVQGYVAMSSGHQPHQSAYAFPGHQQHHIPAHYPFQSNTFSAASGLPSPMPHAAVHHHQQNTHHHHQQQHHLHHHQASHLHRHMPNHGDILHNSVIPTTPSHHQPTLGFPPHMTTAMGNQGQHQPLPAHIVPPHTISHHQTHTMPHHHNNQQPQSTQFIYVAPEQQHVQHQDADTLSPSVSVPETVSVSSPPPPAEELGGGDANLCANNNNNDIELNSEDKSYSKLSPIDNTLQEIKPKKTDNDQSGAIPAKEGPSKFTLSEIEFGGPVVFDTEPQPSTNSSSPIEKAPAKSPASKARPKKSQLPSSSPKPSKSSPSPSSSKNDKSSTSKPKQKTGMVIEKMPETKCEKINTDTVHNDKKKIDNSIVNTNAIRQSLHVADKEITKSSKMSPSLLSSSTKPAAPSNNKSSVNEKTSSTPPDSIISIPIAAKEESSFPETNKISLEVEKNRSDSDNNIKSQQPSAPTAPKSWSSLFGKQTPGVPHSQVLSSSNVVELQRVANNLQEVPKNSTVSMTTTTPIPAAQTSVRHWQEQERHRGKERSDNLLPVDNVKAVGVRQDPLAPKLLAKLSNFPISYIPIIVQPRGLQNGRNICFMNATLQVLMGCPPFIHLFRAFRNLPARTGGNSSTPVFDSLVQFVNSFQHCQRTKQEGALKKSSGYAINLGAPFIPESLLGVAQHILGLNIGVQHDAEEFLSQILSICNEEVERIIKMNNMDTLNNNSCAGPDKPVMGNGTHHHQNGDIHNYFDEGNEDDDGSWVQVGPKNYCVETNVNNCGQTPLSAIFAGMSRSTLVRDSGKTSDTVDSFFTLKLDIQADSVHTVRDALVRLNATEDVHDVDGTKVKGHRRMFFDELPPVLIMHLKLFKYSNGIGQKIQKNISFDVHLQIPKEMMSRFGKSKYNPQKSRTYKLFGVVNHHGIKMDDGHYTSDVFLPIVNGWVHFDDTKVTVSDETTVLKHQDKSMPYLLFYRHVDV